jgi:hypothetical protein
VACGLAIDDQGFDPSSLAYWRGRIARSERPHRVNEAIRLIVEQTGVLKGRRRRAVDSTILADAVATQDTITQLVSAIRRVAREVPGAAEQIAQVCTGHDYSKPGKPKIDWDDPAAKDALVSALVSDANAVAAAFRDAKLDEAAACAVALLALVAGQDVEPAGGSDGTDGRWRIARKVAEDRVISTVDPDARHTRKSPEARRDGYRAHVAADPETGIITDEKLTRAAGTENSDPAVAEEFLAAETGADAPGRADSTADGQIPGGAGEPDDGQAAGDNLAWYGDSAYGTGDLRGAIDDAGHAAVIKPKPLQAPVEGGFTVDLSGVDLEICHVCAGSDVAEMPVAWAGQGWMPCCCRTRRRRRISPWAAASLSSRSRTAARRAARSSRSLAVRASTTPSSPWDGPGPTGAAGALAACRARSASMRPRRSALA